MADAALEQIVGKACGLLLYPEFGFKCLTSDSDDASDSVFGDNWVISVGYVLMIVVAIPMGYWNLDDNMGVQLGAFVGLCFIVLWWSGASIQEGFEGGALPVATRDFNGLVGTIFFNFAFVVTVPSWINEKRCQYDLKEALFPRVGPICRFPPPNCDCYFSKPASGCRPNCSLKLFDRPKVSTTRSIVSSTLLGSMMFVIVGVLGASAFSFSGGDDLLAVKKRRRNMTHPNSMLLQMRIPSESTLHH